MSICTKVMELGAIINEFPTIVFANFELSLDIYICVFYRGEHKSRALEIYYNYYDCGAYDGNQLPQLAAIFADEPSYEDTYESICAEISRGLNLI